MSSSLKIPTLIVGAGRVGTTFALGLKKRGAPLLGLIARDSRKRKLLSSKYKLPVSCDFFSLLPKARLILIAVPDDAIGEVARDLQESGGIARGAILAHLSGTVPSSILLGKENFAFSLHPLQTFSEISADGALLHDVPMIFEGDGKAAPVAKALASTVGGRFVKLRGEKRLYHAAACMAGNYLVTLVSVAATLNRKAGLAKKDSLSILFPILRTALANLEAKGISEALTGPIERGDVETVREHLQILRKNFAGFAEIYEALGAETLKLAEAKGLPRRKGEEMRKALGGKRWEK